MAGRSHRLAGVIGVVVSMVIGVAFLLWLVLLAPKLIVPARPDGSLNDVQEAGKRHELEDGRLKLQNDARTTLLQALGGAVIALSAFFTYRQLKTGREQLRVAMEGQITERFTRAIDQLGNDKGQLDVTLGGIYALQRIAKDSPDDRATIAEILSAYVRSRAPWPPRVPGQLPWHELLSWLPRGPGRLPEDTPLAQLPSLQERCPDVQAALTVLGHIPSGDHGRLNLQRTDLRGADLVDADLEGAPSLIVTQFKGRPRLLQRTDLRRADPMDADLGEAPSLTTVHFGLPGPEGRTSPTPTWRARGSWAPG